MKYDADGLVAAIVQEVGTNEVLMLGWMNEEALRRTLDTGRTWFWSRSRQEYWCKGETSGDRQWVREARYDCDVDVAALPRRAGGPGRVPHRGAQLLLPRVRQRRHARARSEPGMTVIRPSRDEFVALAARPHRGAGVA